MKVVYYESMKRKLIYNLYMSVGVMEDYKLRLAIAVGKPMKKE
jgi:hypothetical protein